MSKLLKSINVKDTTSPAAYLSGSDQFMMEDSHAFQVSKTSHTVEGIAGLDMVVSEPQKYIRIIFTLDFFLAHGRSPARGEITAFLHSVMDEKTANVAAQSFEGDLSAMGMSPPPAEVGTQETLRQQADGRSSQQAESTASINGSNLTALQACSQEPSITLTDDPLAQLGMNPENFSFETFMTDGPFTGIEQLQNILETYPSWPRQP